MSFDSTSTAAEVLADVDLTGRTALVTGGYSGIGTALVAALVDAGAHVLVPARRPEQAREDLAAVDPDAITIGELDLSDQASVAAYASTVLSEDRDLDLVITNAGIMATPETRTAEGWELQLATNHLGHYALVNRLWPRIREGARVVSVASGGHFFSGMRWDDPWFEGGYDKWDAYGQSKTANILFAVHLDKLAAEHGVRAFALHPGAILTPLGRHLGAEDLHRVMVTDEQGELVLPDFKTPEQGAATAAWAATSPDLDDRGGLYLEDCSVAPLATEDEKPTADSVGVRPYAVDPAEAERLWEWSAELTGLDAFASRAR